MALPLTKPPIEDDEAERLALEAAIDESLADPRASVDHAIVRVQLLADAERATQRIEELAARRAREG